MRLFAALVLALAALPARGAEVAGVTLAASEQLGPRGPTLVLNGAGLRRKFVFRVYVIGLYLAHRASAPEEVLALAGAKHIEIHMLREVGAEEFTQALFDGLRANQDPGAWRALEPRAQRLAAQLAALTRTRDGMTIALDWLPGEGTRLAADGKPLGEPTPGEDLYRALLAIWLGPHPVQEDLKAALLGGSQGRR